MKYKYINESTDKHANRLDLSMQTQKMLYYCSMSEVNEYIKNSREKAFILSTGTELLISNIPTYLEF